MVNHYAILRHNTDHLHQSALAIDSHRHDLSPVTLGAPSLPKILIPGALNVFHFQPMLKRMGMHVNFQHRNHFR